MQIHLSDQKPTGNDWHMFTVTDVCVFFSKHHPDKRLADIPPGASWVQHVHLCYPTLRWLKLQQHVWQALNEIVWEFMEHIAHFVVCGNVFVLLIRLHYRWTVHAGLCSHGVSHSSPSYTFLTKSNEHLLHSWGLKVNVIALKIVVTL